MQWNDHYSLKGKHAFLSPSSNAWLNYDPDKLRSAYINNENKKKGTMLHAFAEVAIQNKIKLANHKKALNQFVNDAIGFDMTPEMILFYSDNCFGTADAILFENNILRIHDLKTGLSKASFNQLLVYCALFCLEYEVNPYKITCVCRIYQYAGFEEIIFAAETIEETINKIVLNDKILSEILL